MKKAFIFVILFCVMAFSSYAQEFSVFVNYTETPDLADKSLVFYNANRKLTWDDFQAPPAENSRAAAITSAGLGYDEKFSLSDDKAVLFIKVYCDFSPTQSWVKEIGRNDYILKHEQHHFDVAYINTLLFIKKLKAAHFTSDNYKKGIRDLYKEACINLHNMQVKYDTETNNGLIKDKQAEWSDNIDVQLQQLQATY